MKSKEEIEEALEYYNQLLQVYKDTAIVIGSEMIALIIAGDDSVDYMSNDAIALALQISETDAAIRVLEWVLDRKYAYERRN